MINNNIKKILIISGALKLGGGQRQLMHLINRTDNKKFQISLYLFSFSGMHINDLPDHIELLNKSYPPSSKLYQKTLIIRRIILNERPDIIYSNLAGSNIPSLLAQRLVPKKLRAIQIAAVVNNPSKYSFYNNIMLKILLPFADKVIACADGVKSYIIENYNIDPYHVLIIHNSADLAIVRKQSKEPIYHKWFKQDNIVLITVARLAQQKGCDILIRAFSLLIEKYPVYLLIIGDGPERKNLESLATKLKITDRIDFLGFIKDSNAYVKKSDIFVLSSRWEGMATVIIEAAAVKTPIIATNAPYGSSDVIEDGKDGFLVPVDNYKNLAEKIALLIEDRTTIDKFVNNAEHKVGLEFDARVMVSKYEMLFHQLYNMNR